MEEKPLLKDRITEELRERIGKLQADVPVRIPSERDLSEMLGVSRISVRAAIKNLVQEGRLVQEQGRGTFITPRAASIKSLHILCSPDIKQNDPFYNEFLVQLTNEAAKRSIHLFIVHPDRLPDRRQDCPLLAVGQWDAGSLATFAGLYDRVAMLLGDAVSAPNVTQLVFDDERIGREAADRLLDLGHRELVLLAGPDRYRSARLRAQGFADRVRERGGAFAIRAAKMNWQGGYESGDEVAGWLRDGSPGSGAVPTALFAANDWMAAGVIQKLKECGFRIPEMLSVVGCDDIPLSSQFEPAITTFRLDMKAMIARTLEALQEDEAPERDAGREIKLAADFVERDSLIPFR